MVGKEIVFWQNIISPHMSYFFKHLTKYAKVVLIVQESLSDERRKQGWENVELSDVEVIILRNEGQVSQLAKKYEDCENIFSGFRSYSFIGRAFDLLIKKQKVSIIAEAPIVLNISQRILKQIKYKFFNLKYGKNVKNIFAMGELGVKWYRNCGFSEDILVQFQYFVEPFVIFDETAVEIHKEKHLIFVGQLIKRKGVDLLLEAYNECNNKRYNLDIIGSGVLKESLDVFVKKEGLQNRVFFLSNLSNSKVRSLIKNAHYLILPSLFDGWGAVVNEALSVGTKVLVSNLCGSNAMIDNGFNGYIFDINDKNEFVKILNLIMSEEEYEKENISTHYKNKLENLGVDVFVQRLKLV